MSQKGNISMRIIKTTVRNRKVLVIASVVTALAVPMAAITISELLPDAYKYMSEAAKYSDVLIKSSSGNDSVNNGNLMLYIPEKPVSDTEIPTEKPSEQKEAALLIRNISAEKEDLSVFSDNNGEIYETTFNGSLGESFINLPYGGQVRNCTDLSNEFVRKETTKPHNINIELYSDEPQVLIMHTHTTESYELTEKSYYDSEYTSRSSDPANGVVAVGAAIAEELSTAGISVIHDGTIHDEQYTGAYERSLETVERILDEYPSIKIVLDIHRDAIEDNGSRVSAVTEINGRKAAQVMIISAADDGTYGIPDYLENFHFACAFQQALELNYPTLTRPVLFQYCHYNQHTTTGSLLLEIGSHGNTVEQAVYSGHLIGKALAGVFTGKNTYEQEVIRTMPRFFMDRLR